jgi:hypothetical protein
MTMQVPLEIAFHNTESSEWAEHEIRNQVAELEEIYGRLISCRVRVDQRAENRARTIPPVVRIELGIPGHKDLVVSHEPEHLLRKYQHPDLRNAISEAFRIAQRRLRDLKEQREGRTKEPRHDSENQSLGQVVELTPDTDHGFSSPRKAGSFISTAMPCWLATSTGSTAATRSITSRMSATPARSPPRCA